MLFFAGWPGRSGRASGYVGAFIRASNVIYEVEEGRPFWKLRPLQIAVTLVMVLLAALASLALVLSGPLATSVGDAVGLSDEVVDLYRLAKWPVLVVVLLAMISLLYYSSPEPRVRGLRWVTPGSLLALGIWVVASALFAFYVGSFGSYDKTYGTLGGVMSFLVWLWITNIALLLGAELNAELERRKRAGRRNSRRGGNDPTRAQGGR